MRSTDSSANFAVLQDDEMIDDVPDPDEMMQLAVQAYFVAWKEATSLFDWIEETGVISFDVEDEKLVARAGSDGYLTASDSEENLKRYEELMQGKLRLVYSLVQHSQELVLKSHICKVSPFLLLMGTDARSLSGKDVSFTALKTIDAGDLVKVVSAFTELKIEESFKQKIDTVRLGRNAIQHLGKHEDIELLEPIRILTRQYIQLFPGRNWLQDLNVTEDNGLDEIFHFHGTSTMQVLHELSMLHRLTTRKLAKAVLGVDVTSTLYGCHDCVGGSEYDSDPSSAPSIERKKGAMHGDCKLCEGTFRLRRRKCACGCDVAFAEGEGRGKCCKCGAEARTTGSRTAAKR